MAEEVQIWTDIDGFHNNDPRYVANTKAISQLSFDEAAELSYFGAKILHPQSVLPALLALAMAGTHTDFSWWLGIIALFGIICAHLGILAMGVNKPLSNMMMRMKKKAKNIACCSVSE